MPTAYKYLTAISGSDTYSQSDNDECYEEGKKHQSSQQYSTCMVELSGTCQHCDIISEFLSTRHQSSTLVKMLSHQ